MDVSRRKALKRISVWTLVVALLVAWYVSSCPIVNVLLSENRLRFNPTARKAFKMAYAPIIFCIDADLPGARRCQQYMQWIAYNFHQLLHPPPPPPEQLEEFGPARQTISD